MAHHVHDVTPEPGNYTNPGDATPKGDSTGQPRPSARAMAGVTKAPTAYTVSGKGGSEERATYDLPTCEARMSFEQIAGAWESKLWAALFNKRIGVLGFDPGNYRPGDLGALERGPFLPHQEVQARLLQWTPSLVGLAISLGDLKPGEFENSPWGGLVVVPDPRTESIVLLSIWRLPMSAADANAFNRRAPSRLLDLQDQCSQLGIEVKVHPGSLGYTMTVERRLSADDLTWTMTGRDIAEGRSGDYPLAQVASFAQFLKEAEGTLRGAPAQSSNSNGSGACYIATAVYGDYDAREVRVLRRFRDEKLSAHRSGRAFIRTYYAVSPHLAVFLQRATPVNRAARMILDSMVATLEKSNRR